MKKLLKTLVLALALVLTFANGTNAVAADPIYGKVVDILGGAPVKWTLYANEEGNDTYALVFHGTLKDFTQAHAREMNGILRRVP